MTTSMTVGEASAVVIEATTPVELPPTINVKRKVCVVFTKDNMGSVIAASIIKRVLEQRLSEEAALSYEFTYVEIGSLYIRTAYDAFLWVGLEPVKKACSPEVITEYEEAAHYVSSDRTLGDVREVSVFDEELTKFCESADVRPHIVFDNQAMPLSRPRGEGIYFGCILHSLCCLSEIVQELNMENFDRLISMASDAQKTIADFYTTHAKTTDIMTAYCTMQKALEALGLPFTQLNDKTTDEKLVIYIAAYRNVRSVLEQNIELQRVYHNRTRMLVSVTRMADDFWLARRVISMTFRRFYNYRLADHGIQYSTNVPADAVGLELRVSDFRN